MKLVQLRSLIAIVENGLNITRAANQLHTSQAGISKQLGKLEEELGTQLFIRHGKRLAAITPAGKKAVCHSRLIMREVKDITELTRDLSGKRRAAKQQTVSFGGTI